MKKYSGYPETVDSNIPWLGKIPQHWKVHQLKRAVAGCVNGIWGDEADGKNDIAVIRVADFDRAKSRVNVNEFTVRSIPVKDRKGRLLEHGDLLIEKSGGGDKQLVGAVVIHERPLPAVTSNFVARMTPQRGHDSSFLRYVFDHLYSGRVNYPSIKQTTGIQNLDTNQYLAEYFSFPEQSEQEQIAAFLDHETAKIDRLIARQERLIELLKEKRQAVISHAVTKGLNPDAPMKDSGVEWLGEVPEHWVVSQLKRFSTRVVVGIAEAATHAYVDDGVPILRATNVRTGKLIGDLIYLDPSYAAERGSKRIKGGDLVTVRTGNAGVTAVVPDELDGCQCFTMLITTLKKSQYNRFFEYLINSPVAQSYFSVEGWGTAQINISVPILQNLPVAAPDLQEQESIARELDKKVARIDDLVCKSTRAIDFLQEHRTALISAAVTGKIDVRGWQMPNIEPKAAATAASA